MKITIEKIGLNEIEALQQIGQKTFLETFSHSNSTDDMNNYLTEKFSGKQLRLELQNLNSEFYFSIINNLKTGYLKINVNDAQTELKDYESMEIERIYVLEEYQGKKLGKALFNTAVKRAQELGKKYIWLGVWEQNSKAIRFYENRGFEKFGEHIFTLGQDKQTDILMKLKI